MQTSGLELIDVSKESKETLALYGAEPGARSFANNCLLARRQVERGVRFVHLYHTDWGQHGGPGTNLNVSLDQICQQIDRPCAALVQDLKSWVYWTRLWWYGEESSGGHQWENSARLSAVTITSTPLPCSLPEPASNRVRAGKHQ